MLLHSITTNPAQFSTGDGLQPVFQLGWGDFNVWEWRNNFYSFAPSPLGNPELKQFFFFTRIRWKISATTQMFTSHAKLFSANYEQFRLFLSQFFSLSINTTYFPRLIFSSSRWLCPRPDNSKQAVKLSKMIIFPNPDFQPQKYSDPIRSGTATLH